MQRLLRVATKRGAQCTPPPLSASRPRLHFSATYDFMAGDSLDPHSYAWHRYIQAQRQRRKHEFELGKLVVNSKKVAHEELNEILGDFSSLLPDDTLDQIVLWKIHGDESSSSEEGTPSM